MSLRTSLKSGDRIVAVKGDTRLIGTADRDISFGNLAWLGIHLDEEFPPGFSDVTINVNSWDVDKEYLPPTDPGLYVEKGANVADASTDLYFLSKSGIWETLGASPGSWVGIKVRDLPRLVPLVKGE